MDYRKTKTTEKKGKRDHKTYLSARLNFPYLGNNYKLKIIRNNDYENKNK